MKPVRAKRTAVRTKVRIEMEFGIAVADRRVDEIAHSRRIISLGYANIPRAIGGIRGTLKFPELSIWHSANVGV